MCDDILTLMYNQTTKSIDASFSCEKNHPSSINQDVVTTVEQGYGGMYGNGSNPSNARVLEGGYDLVRTSKTNNNYVTLFGRRRKVVLQGRKKMVNVKGSLMPLSEAKKLDKMKK